MLQGPYSTDEIEALSAMHPSSYCSLLFLWGMEYWKHASIFPWEKENEGWLLGKGNCIWRW